MPAPRVVWRGSLVAGIFLVLGLLLGVQVLLEQDAELLAQRLELGQVLLVLLLVLDLGLDACCDHTGSANRHVCDEIKLVFVCHTLEDAHGSGEVVNPPGGPQGGRADGRRGDQIVSEGVVQVALRRVARVSVSPVCPAWPGSLQPGATLTWSSKTSWTLSNSFSYLYRQCFHQPLILHGTALWPN